MPLRSSMVNLRPFIVTCVMVTATLIIAASPLRLMSVTALRLLRG